MTGAKRVLRKYQKPLRAASFDPNRAWFSNPVAFNDPLDVNLSTTDTCFSVFANERHFKDVVAELLKNDKVKEYNLFNEEIVGKMRDRDSLTYEKEILFLIKQRFNASGILCLFSGDDSEAMWSYYADDARGFAVEYECSGTMTLALRNPHLFSLDVSYFRTLPSVPLAELIFSPSTAVAKMYASKRIDWAHEGEFRFVNPEASGLLNLPCGLCVKRVIAGHRMDSETKRLLAEHCESFQIPVYERYVRIGNILERQITAAA